MNSIVILVALFIVFGVILAVIAFVAYRRVLRHAKGVERGLKMVPLLIHLPPPSDDTENSGGRDVREVMREKISQAQVLYDLIAGTAQNGFKSSFYGQRHIAFEIVASNGLVHYFAAVPIALVSLVEQAVVTAYPGARLEEVEDHNIFNPQGRLTGTVGGELVLRHDAAYPIAILDQMERDPMIGILNALSKLQLGEGAAIQIMLRPADPNWVKRAAKVVAKKRHKQDSGLGFGAADLAKAAIKSSDERREEGAKFEPSRLEETMLQAVEDKSKHPGYEVLVRVLASAPTYDRAQVLMRSITTAFALFEAPGSNGFQFIEGRDMQGLVTAFIFRFFPPEVASNVLNSVELATLFHLPDAQFTPTTQVERQQSKQVDGPVSTATNGLLLGYNFYRGVKKEIRLSPEDRRRHTYIVGQTGTGKSTILENLAVQDMLAGNGFAFIDPHGDTAEKLISMVPKERAEDVIYFNPGDMEHPLGLNLFEFSSPEQKDFLIQESINMLYKLYDPGKTGIIGPRFEHWYRNAALTLMADPHGASFIEIPKVFTDSAYLKEKFKYLTDPTVIDFWTKEMGQTSDYHKSEMLGFFVSKFGAFQSNEMMRNIIGQTKSGFNLRDVMDNKKILIVNLGKGSVGELNSQLLGMMFVMKFQAAAMSRAKDTTEAERQDFCLYVDEFQNFSTDSFASILSEARKYRLNLIVANQFIGQLSDEIREAVFGNVGTMLSFRCGPEDAEFLVKQFQPVFDVRDLVNLPNYNAVMKLLLGGLPSQPFSITMLPPLGQAHVEMGTAIKQLSAAKYGVLRATAEADIFARLQNQPRIVAPSAATASPAGAGVPTVDQHAAMLPPAPAVTAPAIPAATASPATTPAPVAVPPPSPAAPAVNPPDGLSLSQLRTTAPPPLVPPPPVPLTPPPPVAASTPIVAVPPSSVSGRISDIVKVPLSAAVASPVAEPALEIPKQPSAPVPVATPPAPVAPPVQAAPVVAPAAAVTPPPLPPAAPALQPAPVPELKPELPRPVPVAAAESKPALTPTPTPASMPATSTPSTPTLLIEARETDGRPAKDSQRRIESRETDGHPNRPPQPLRIEAHEVDGKSKTENLPVPASKPQPQPVTQPLPAPPFPKPVPKPAVSPQPQPPQAESPVIKPAPKPAPTPIPQPVPPPSKPRVPSPTSVSSLPSPVPQPVAVAPSLAPKPQQPQPVPKPQPQPAPAPATVPTKPPAAQPQPLKPPVQFPAVPVPVAPVAPLPVPIKPQPAPQPPTVPAKPPVPQPTRPQPPVSAPAAVAPQAQRASVPPLPVAKPQPKPAPPPALLPKPPVKPLPPAPKPASARLEPPKPVTPPLPPVKTAKIEDKIQSDAVPTPEAIAAEVAEVLSQLPVDKFPKDSKPASLPPSNPQVGKTMIATHLSPRLQGRKSPQPTPSVARPAIVLPPSKPAAPVARTSVPVPPPEKATVNKAYAAAATPQPPVSEPDSHFRSIQPPADFSMHPIQSAESAIDSVAMPAAPRPEAVFTPQPAESEPDLPVFVPDPLPEPQPAAARLSLPKIEVMHKRPAQPVTPPPPKPQATPPVPMPQWKPVPKPAVSVKPQPPQAEPPAIKPAPKSAPTPSLPPSRPPEPKPPMVKPQPPLPKPAAPIPVPNPAPPIEPISLPTPPPEPQPAPESLSIPPMPPAPSGGVEDVKDASTPAAPAKPDLKPGEIFVDENGDVIQGE